MKPSRIRWKALWHVERGLWIRDLGGDVILFEFAEDKERQKVLSMEPRFFEKSLVVYNLPFRGMVEKVGQTIGKGFGKCIKVDADESGRCHVDISKPLRRGRRIQVGDGRDPVKVDFKYERRNFCYGCWILGHTVSKWFVVDEGGGRCFSDCRYGDFLHGPTKLSQKEGNCRARSSEVGAGDASRNSGGGGGAGIPEPKGCLSGDGDG
ncbi:hypothetical protein TIFTF001_042397 [Ficus carica]|uniref:Zinc knuckle CX2CX4HX4C domain-containing protein n=1 Tax=Ficus carica TaxID=3494 RepID=A0AA87ZLL8_FICCA|nr:hypothetical protein TIFTF001_042397 [Ficus carica]